MRSLAPFLTRVGPPKPFTSWNTCPLDRGCTHPTKHELPRTLHELQRPLQNRPFWGLGGVPAISAAPRRLRNKGWTSQPFASWNTCPLDRGCTPPTKHELPRTLHGEHRPGNSERWNCSGHCKIDHFGAWARVPAISATPRRLLNKGWTSQPFTSWSTCLLDKGCAPPPFDELEPADLRVSLIDDSCQHSLSESPLILSAPALMALEKAHRT